MKHIILLRKPHLALLRRRWSSDAKYFISLPPSSHKSQELREQIWPARPIPVFANRILYTAQPKESDRRGSRVRWIGKVPTACSIQLPLRWGWDTLAAPSRHLTLLMLGDSACDRIVGLQWCWSHVRAYCMICTHICSKQTDGAACYRHVIIQFFLKPNFTRRKHRLLRTLHAQAKASWYSRKCYKLHKATP